MSKKTTSRSKKRVFDHMSVLSNLKMKQIRLAKIRGYEISENEEDFLKKPYDLDDYSLEELFNGVYTKTVEGIKYTLDFTYIESNEDMDLGAVVELISEHRGKGKNYNVIYLNLRMTGPAKSRAMIAKNEVDAKIEFWDFLDLFIDPIEHVTVPKHTLLTPDEIARQLPLASTPDEKKNLKFLMSLPPMSDDNIVRWFGGEVGSVFRVDRPSEYFSGTLPVYRYTRKVKV